MARQVVDTDRLAAALDAADAAVEAASVAAEAVAEALRVMADPEAKPARLTDQRINTTLRIEPALLRELKIIAARERVRVNDLLLEGAHHVLSLHKARTQVD